MMGFARLAAPTGFGGRDIAQASAGDALQAGTGRRLSLPGQGLRPGASLAEGDCRADTHIENWRFFRQATKMSSCMQP